MAKKKRAGTSRSQHIRDYLQKNPDASPKEITEALAAKGIKVSVGLASNVKSTSGLGKRRKRKKTAKKKATGRTARKKAVRTRRAAALTAQDLLEAKKLVDELGGIDEARTALDALEQLQ